MLVKVGNTLYSSDETPIIVVMDSLEVARIYSNSQGAGVTCHGVFPAGWGDRNQREALVSEVIAQLNPH